MTTINRLAVTDTVSAGDTIPLYSQDFGSAVGLPISVLSDYVLALVSPDDKVTQYAAPSATGFSVQVTNSDASVWLILTPGGTYANGTLVLPTSTLCVHLQEILVNCTQIVTTLTITGNGSTVTGAPTTLAANASFRLKYDLVTHTWYKV